MPKKFPWKTKSSKQIYKNHWITFFEDKVVRPDGKDGIYAYLKPMNFVEVAAVDENMNVYLTRDSRYPDKHYSWELVGGWIEKGESTLQTAKREVKEELGITADKWTKLGYFYIEPAISTSIGHVFLAQSLKKGKRELEGSEQSLGMRKIPLSKAYDWVEKNRITDGASISCLFKVRKYFEREG